MSLLRGRRDQASLEEFTEVWNQYNELLHSHEVLWKQRSKSLWLKEGDLNSRYFHALASTRKQQNKISKLRDDQGQWCTHPDKVNDLIMKYFTHLFSSGCSVCDEVLDCVKVRINAEKNQTLMEPFTAVDVRDSIFSMHPDKSSGLDGMNPAFYQKFWHIVGNDISNRAFPATLDDTSIVLIPKKAQPERLDDVRPIALCNVLYKSIAKMLANRMKVVMGSVVSKVQSAFVPSRAITDNILISAEIVHYLKRKRQGKEGVAALKIDMSKAYDRIEWGFLKAIMLRMGFAADWVDLIMLCVTTVNYKAIREGIEVGPIVPSRGLRQGDPLSPYIFILCAEGLNLLIHHYEQAGLLHGATVARGALSITHFFFTDDCFLFFKATDKEACLVKNILAMYGSTSGQIANYNKSSISFNANA
ncbi:reverse transcriptase domain-containing protein [Citrus sinensis]|uniref:Reverse transcriptase domain-containing protein n=1 Tax=Citrus sinensis TaxID=2711 RepID=A0ACB8I339_CITSI|nr:reverse transcriptase domain-containing protein [Citrus sinensis]